MYKIVEQLFHQMSINVAKLLNYMLKYEQDSIHLNCRQMYISKLDDVFEIPSLD